VFCPNPKCPDFEDSGTPTEYVDGIVECPMCGARLVDRMPDTESLRDQTSPKKDNTDVESSDELTEELVVVASFNFRQDADLARTFLIAKGIEVFESPDDCGGMDPGLGFGTRTRLLVHKNNADKAIALLDEIEEP
jgi:hypothetical protein